MIPFSKIDLPESVLEDCNAILKSGNLTNGIYVEKFEKVVAKISGMKYAVATNSCTTGLMLVCRQVFRDCKTIGLPDYTWNSTKAAIIENDFKPVWLDIDKDTWVVESLKDADGYLLVDTFGNQCDVNTDKPTVIDCAHSFGIKFNKKYKVGVYSFAPAKTFTCGEGGVIVTDDKLIYDSLKKIMVWAGRMQEVNACIGLYYAENVKKILEEKKRIFKYYKDNLPFQFQNIKKSNLNIVNAKCESKEMRDFIFERISKVMKSKIRYALTSGEKLPISQDLYDTNFYIPIYWGVDYKEVVKQLKIVVIDWQQKCWRKNVNLS